MEDILLQKLFEKDRWEKAIEKGIFKDMDKGVLRRLTDPRTRAKLYAAIRDGNYSIAPPHMALIPKDKPGEFRTVYVNENIDRIFLSITNDMLFELCSDMISKYCKSYQKGIGCGKVVQQVSKKICNTEGKVIGWKSDLSKYFDSVPIDYIDDVFDRLEVRFGRSKVIDVIREYYHTDLCFDTENNIVEHYQSLKQGCAVASFLADIMLYDIDEELSKHGFYVRYSDDCLFIGKNYEEAMEIMKSMLSRMKLSLNPKKVEYLTHDKWFKFLGFSIKGERISLSSGRIKAFQKEIESRTIRDYKNTPTKAVHKVVSYLYHGDYEGHSWASNVLPIINSESDIKELNNFVLDCLRAVATKKRKLGGLGYVPTKNEGVICRGIGKNVKANRMKTEEMIDGFMSLNCARLAMLSDKGAFETLVRQL